MRRFCLFAVIYSLLVFSGNAQSMHNVSRGALWAGAAVDLATTEIFLHRGYAEANPMLQNRAVRFSAVIGGTALVDLLTGKLRKTNPRAAMLTNFAIGGGKMTLGFAWNLKR